MPDESTTPVWTTQTSQNNQTVANQSWNDFMLDFGDLWDAAPVAEEVKIDSLSQEEKTDDEFGFDIDLGWDNESSGEEVVDEPKTEDSAAKDVSVDAPEEETVNDFNLSMDYEWTNEEETISDNEEMVPDEEEVVSDNEEVIPDEEEIKLNEEGGADEEKMATEDEERTSDGEEFNEDEIISDEVLSFTNDDTISEESVEDNEETIQEEEETTSDEEEVISDNEEIVPDDEETSNEEWSLNFIKDEDNGSGDLENVNQPNEWHLFHQINEDNQNEISFDLDQSNVNNESFQIEENSENKPLFMGTNEDISLEQNWDINFDLPEVSDNSWLTELDMDLPEQKQPELGDLLWNSPIDLSKELNEASEDSDSNLMNEEIPSDSIEAWNQDILEDTISESTSEEIVPESSLEEHISEPIQENISESVLEDVVPNSTLEDTLEPTSQEIESESAISVDSNEFLLDVPQVESDTQNIQQETVENSETIQPEEQTQTDATVDVVNNVASQINEQNVEVPEINISTPVELSDTSSNQTEATPVETESQVQSTLSLDQILDSELLSNPQYADNSKASPQNLPTSGWKGKAWILIWVGVAVLGCCVAVLAFPSITTLIKPAGTTSSWTVVEIPTEDPHPSAPDEPTGWEDPIGVDDPEIPENPDLENPDISWGDGWATAVSIIDDGDDSWDWETGTEPVPFVWTDDWQDSEPEIQEPVVEEVDANQILDVISSFKSQAETYYSLGEQQADKQLMKYSQWLLALCDNYSDKVNNWEWTDSESLASFKTTANKIISKIITYLGGDDEEVQVIREATIDGESYFPWKDELKDYIYNNR